MKRQQKKTPRIQFEFQDGSKEEISLEESIDTDLRTAEFLSRSDDPEWQERGEQLRAKIAARAAAGMIAGDADRQVIELFDNWQEKNAKTIANLSITERVKKCLKSKRPINKDRDRRRLRRLLKSGKLQPLK